MRKMRDWHDLHRRFSPVKLEPGLFIGIGFEVAFKCLYWDFPLIFLFLVAHLKFKNPEEVSPSHRKVDYYSMLLQITSFFSSSKRLGSTKPMKSVEPVLKNESMIACNPARHTWALWAGRGHQQSQTQTSNGYFCHDQEEVHIIARFGPTTSPGPHIPAPRQFSFDNRQFLVWPFSQLKKNKYSRQGVVCLFLGC